MFHGFCGCSLFSLDLIVPFLGLPELLFMCLLDVFCICLFVFLVCTKQQYPNLGGYWTVSRKASDMIDSKEQSMVHIDLPWSHEYKYIYYYIIICIIYIQRQTQVILLMEEIMHQLIGNWPHSVQGFYTSQVVEDFFHQQFLFMALGSRWFWIFN